MLKGTPTTNGTVGERLEKGLMRLIVSGRLPPGARVLSAATLAVELKAHPITVQRALQRLAAKGVLERRPRLGTFVRPGHDAFRTAVLFGPALTDESSCFYRALYRTLRELSPHPRWHCFLYDGLNEASTAALPADALDAMPQFRHFLWDHQQYVFRGFIAVGVGAEQWSAISRTAAGLPLVRFGLDGEIHFDYAHFAASGAGRVLKEGARRLSYLRTLPSDSPDDDVTEICRMVRDTPGAALETVQFATRPPVYDERRDTVFCQRLVRRWMRERRLPDAILISDDVAMRGLAHALVSSGLTGARAPRVLCWANKGIRLHYGMPVLRYEVDPAAFARTLAKTLVARTAGKDVAPCRIRGRIVSDGDGAEG